MSSGSSGEFFVSAELTRLGKIALPTSRNTKGFDVVVTDKESTKSNFIQVKTNKKKAEFWIVNKPITPANDRYYVFVNLIDESSRPEYFIVPSQVVWDEYIRMNNLRDIDSMSPSEKNNILDEIKSGKSGWNIVYDYGIKIGAVRQIASDNNKKIKYDRGSGEDFPFCFKISSNQKVQFKDKWELLNI